MLYYGKKETFKVNTINNTHYNLREFFIVLGYITSFLLSTTANAWFDCDWAYRTEVTITENSGTTLTSYQVRIDLTSTSFNTDYTWSSEGQELRILDTDDLTALDFYIDAWDSVAETATIWVTFPTIAANSNRLIYLYVGNPAETTSASSAAIFTDPGIKFNTRRVLAATTDPDSKAEAIAAFDAAPVNTPGYGCAFITNFNGVNNQNVFGPPNRNNNFIAFSESFFEVLPGEEGIWDFRYGADYGTGGGLYIDDIPLEELWTEDLWWAFNWASIDVLDGSINLTAGFHKLEIIGGEGCCDGGLTVQYRRPGTPNYQTFDTATINVVSRSCPVQAPTVAQGTQTSALANINVINTALTTSDPVNAASNPKVISESIVRMSQNITNNGAGTVTNNSLSLVTAIPPEMSLFLTSPTPFLFTDGAGADTSGLTFSYVSLADLTDNIEFSNDNAISFAYTPSPGANGADASVTHIRVSPQGTMNCSETGNTANFTFDYELLVN